MLCMAVATTELMELSTLERAVLARVPDGALRRAARSKDIWQHLRKGTLLADVRGALVELEMRGLITSRRHGGGNVYWLTQAGIDALA